MKHEETRAIALGAARSKARAMGMKPELLDAEDMLTILDDVARADARLIASQWYLGASTRQIALFRKEWKQWRNEQ